MKTKIFAALLALGLLIGCKDFNNDDPAKPKDGPGIIAPQYLLALELIDKAGNNVSDSASKDASIEIHYTYGGDKLYDLYSENRSYDGICYLITCGIGNYEDQDSLKLSLTWKIKSETIFGDGDVHSIQSEWKRYGSYYPTQCTSFDFEGKTYVPELKNGKWTARVVINR